MNSREILQLLCQGAKNINTDTSSHLRLVTRNLTFDTSYSTRTNVDSFNFKLIFFISQQ
jgi:hypothetical protein